jgi:hypothetical protein
VTREPQDDDTTHPKVDFTPVAPGPLTFTATWAQLTQPGGPPCTASATGTVTVTAPTPARASRQLGYTIGHRPGRAGNNSEFTLSARVISIRAMATAVRFVWWCGRWRACAGRRRARPPPR